jgi:hypothetical protein
MSNAIGEALWQQGAHVAGGRVVVQLILYSLQLGSDTISTGNSESGQRESYVIQSSFWHAPHALTREYMMVLHPHVSSIRGPPYEYPRGSASIMATAKEMRQRGS